MGRGIRRGFAGESGAGLRSVPGTGTEQHTGISGKSGAERRASGQVSL